METRKLLFLVASLAILASPLLAVPDFDGAGYSGGGAAGLVRVAGYYAANGGEYTIYNSSLTNSGYDALTKNVQVLYGNSFQTFCVETGEHTDSPVELWVSTAWKTGSSNVGTPGSHSWKSNQDLDSRTAWLYTKFVTGTLSGYDYTVGNDRKASAEALQSAIWYFQGQTGYTIDAGTQAFIDAANAAVTAGWTGIGNVRILQIWSDDVPGETPYKQDMLYYVVPAPGAVLLAGVGTALVGWLRRRQAL